MYAQHNRNSTVRICFYTLWVLASLIQSYHTELLADEAYYWKYAQNLAWGYFDHPPMVALFIKVGYAVFQNELGIRLMFVIVSVPMIYILELLTQPKRLLYFYLAISSIGAFQFLGLLALPDMPLLLFGTLYLYLYKSYLTKDGILISILLSITIALMLLSKYHGVLLIVFSIIAYPAVVKRHSFWLITIGSLLLFSPHIHWQFLHDFPSIKYHLEERSLKKYDISFTLNYIVSTVLIFSPVVGIVFAWHTLRSKPKDHFERTLYTILTGILVFFFVMSFKGRTEANWVGIAIIPALVIGYKRCEELAWFTKFIRISFVITLIPVCFIRAFLVYDYLPNIPQLTAAKNKIHHTREWVKEIETKAAGRPVVFANKYQYAAWYEYYTGKDAISLNNRIGRQNQYNIWDDEYKLQGKNVMVVPNYKKKKYRFYHYFER